MHKSLDFILREFLGDKVKKYRLIDPKEVVVGEWVRLKCQYGCDGYAQCLTCPPYAPEPEKTRRILECFSSAVLLWKPEDYQELRKICADLERTLFLEGYYKAFAMPSGPCELCGECSCEYPCRYPEKARPSMEACGIDVYATVSKFGFPIEVVRSRDCKANYYALCLIE
ncbi:DUF2284 domain-containing protein [Thermatribacter velox]|jgi:predicted metal-binding protein|uniref:DUF2284 domain-containing protein n=1 Tax=Thermatribacter velox TaxID=3039681 RepID=A0ABZ2YCN6_9BACT